MKITRLIAASLLLPSLAFAQTRGFSVGSLLIDDGSGHTLRLVAPSGLTATTTDFVLPIPPASVTPGYVQAGSATNQYLMWNDVGGYWQATSTGGGLTLPYSQSASSGAILFDLTQTGAGGVAEFVNNDAASSSVALNVSTAGFGQGVYSSSIGGTAVEGITSAMSAAGVLGRNSTGEAVVGISSGGAGVGAVVGRSDGAGYGVRGFNTSTGYGVLGQAGISGGTGTAGRFENVNAANTSDALQVVTNSSGNAARFTGNVVVNGNLTVSGTVAKGGGSFMIDHPLDPKNKILYHSFVESPDMKDIYDGVITLDAKGQATVTMPDWFNALNQDFRYQLTSIGAPGPSLYISKEIEGNSFQIAGGTPNAKVSWQVTGIRHDPYANAHRIQVEVEKTPEQRGTYLHPDAYGVKTTPAVMLQNIPQQGATASSMEAVPQPSTRGTNAK